MRASINRGILIKPLGSLDREFSPRYRLLDDYKNESRNCSIQNDSAIDFGEAVGGATISVAEAPAQGASDDDTGDGDSDPDRRRLQHPHQYIYKSTPSYTLPNDGFVRLRHILQAIPISKSTWWAGVKTGRYPQPVRTLGQRITAWRVEDIRELIKNAA